MAYFVSLKDYLGRFGSMWDADANGQHPLVFNRDAAGDGERFELVGLEEAVKDILSKLQPVPPQPKPPTHGALTQNLTVAGQFFRLEDGTPFTAIQCSDFALLAKWQNGEDITPQLTQRRAAGFNMLRVWTAFDNIPGIGTFTTINYANVPAFVELCGLYGLYVEFTAYTGWNDKSHWDKLVDAVYDLRILPLVELVNELDQNTNEPDAHGRVFSLSDYTRAPEGLLCSHGSNGSQQQPVTPYWDYSTFHTNDASEWPRKVGHNAMEVSAGTPDWTASNKPTLSNENTRYCDKAQSPIYAFDAAAGAALLCAGSCFHSVSGKASVLWLPEEETIATQWAAGAKSVSLRCQEGVYRHAAELETPDVLRAYQRVLSNGEAFTVLIHK